MTPSCYILYSPSLNKFYIGATHDSADNRLLKHNNHTYGKHRYTANADDWELFLQIDVAEYAHAIRLERKIKAMKSSKYIKNLKRFPEMRNKIIINTSNWLLR